MGSLTFSCLWVQKCMLRSPIRTNSDSLYSLNKTWAMQTIWAGSHKDLDSLIDQHLLSKKEQVVNSLKSKVWSRTQQVTLSTQKIRRTSYLLPMLKPHPRCESLNLMREAVKRVNLHSRRIARRKAGKWRQRGPFPKKASMHKLAVGTTYSHTTLLGEIDVIYDLSQNSVVSSWI